MKEKQLVIFAALNFALSASTTIDISASCSVTDIHQPPTTLTAFSEAIRYEWRGDNGLNQGQASCRFDLRGRDLLMTVETLHTASNPSVPLSEAGCEARDENIFANAGDDEICFGGSFASHCQHDACAPDFDPVVRFNGTSARGVRIRMSNVQSAFSIAFVKYRKSSCNGCLNCDNVTSIDSAFQCDGLQNCPRNESNSYADESFCGQSPETTTTTTTQDPPPGETLGGFSVGIVVGVSLPLSVLLIVTYVSLILCKRRLTETKIVLVTLAACLILMVTFAVLAGLYALSTCLAFAITCAALTVAVFIAWIVSNINAHRRRHHHEEETNRPISSCSSSQRSRNPSFPPTYEQSLSHDTQM